MFCTRYIIKKVVEGKLSVALAVMIDFLASYFSYVLIFGALGLAVLLPSPIYLREVLETLARADPDYTPILFENLIGILLVIVIISSYVSSVWLWAAALATLVIRLLSRSARVISTLQYVLPIKEKPVRSMGIVAFLITLSVMLVWSGFAWVSNLA